MTLIFRVDEHIFPINSFLQLFNQLEMVVSLFPRVDNHFQTSLLSVLTNIDEFVFNEGFQV